MRFFGVAVLGACLLAACAQRGLDQTRGAGTTSTATPLTRPRTLPQKRGPQFLVGLLTEQAQLRCYREQHADRVVNKAKWVNQYYEVGFARVRAKSLDLSRRVGKPVVLDGTRRSGKPTQFILNRTLCPPASGMPIPCCQARNDWVHGRHGYRLLRRKPKGATSASHFAATGMQAFEGLGVKRTNDQLRVTVQNPFAMALVGLAVTVHYEGCYGKPGTPRVTRALGTLAAGRTLSTTFAVHLSTAGGSSRRRLHRAHSVQLTSQSKVVFFELDIPLSKLVQQPPKCPRRR
jgi:hypothetical protein